jgi:Flp pilus assembly protein TadB
VNTTQIIQSLFFGTGALLAVGFVFVLARRRRGSGRGRLREYSRYEGEQFEDDEDDLDELDEGEIEDLLEQAAKNRKKKKKHEPTVDEQLFMAGRFSPAEREDYVRKKKLAPIVFAFIGIIVGTVLGGLQQVVLMALVGGLLGMYLPMMMLRRWVEEQHQEIEYYLPLLIEQIAIGVSSSLDIGPCLSQVVQLCDERDSHNATTKLIKYALYYVKSGVSLEEALIEVGHLSGQAEFKHSLLALSQVSKFGGEITKQLQDLAESVASQREAKIESTIKKLELKASGPVAIVFLAYMLLLGLGIASQFVNSGFVM